MGSYELSMGSYSTQKAWGGCEFTHRAVGPGPKGQPQALAQPSSNGASTIDNLRDLVSETLTLWVHFHVGILLISVY